jgi:hypothetical protein
LIDWFPPSLCGAVCWWAKWARISPLCWQISRASSGSASAASPQGPTAATAFSGETCVCVCVCVCECEWRELERAREILFFTSAHSTPWGKVETNGFLGVVKESRTKLQRVDCDPCLMNKNVTRI